MGNGGSDAANLDELQLCFSVLKNSTLETRAAYAARIFERISHFKVLRHLEGKLHSVGQFLSTLEQLFAKFLPVGGELSLFTRTQELKRKLALFESQLVALINSPASTLEFVILQLLERTEDFGSSSGVSAADLSATFSGLSTSSGFSGSFSPGMPSGKALAAAIGAQAFVETISVLENSSLTGEERSEAAFLSGSLLVTRLLLGKSQSLRRAHKALGQLDIDFPSRRLYLSRVLKMDLATGEVPPHLAPYQMPQTFFDSFINLDWGKLDFANADSGGFYGIINLERNAVYDYIPLGQQYYNVAVLKLFERYVGALFTAIGFVPRPTPGHSFGSFVDAQIALVESCETLPQPTKDEKLLWAAQLFVDGLLEAAESFRTLVYSVEPASHSLDGFLSSSSVFFEQIRSFNAAQEPFRHARSVFSSLLGTTFLSVPGAVPHAQSRSVLASPHAPLFASGVVPTVAPAGASALSKQQKKSVVQPGKSAGKRKALAPSARGALAGADEPGSKQGLVKWLDGNTLFFGGSVFDIAGLSAHCKCKKADKCWPVLLTSKTGANALTVCPNHVAHGDLSSPMHTSPPSFSTSSAQFRSSASPEQCKKAGWNSVKNVSKNPKI